LTPSRLSNGLRMELLKVNPLLNSQHSKFQNLNYAPFNHRTIVIHSNQLTSARFQAHNQYAMFYLQFITIHVTFAHGLIKS
jgi:hypothetical protein